MFITVSCNSIDHDMHDSCGNILSHMRTLSLFVNRAHDQFETHMNVLNLTMSCGKKLKTKDSDCL